MKRTILLLPLGIFLIVAVFLFRDLWPDPSELPSALIGKPFPAFDLPNVQDLVRRLTETDLKGKPTLISVWGTWCPLCQVEHPELTRLVEQDVVIYRTNYKDDNAVTIKQLNELRNPYLLSVSDADGTLGLDLGVYDAPETYLIDKQGIIRHKIIGVVGQKVQRKQLAPLYQRLLDEPETRWSASSPPHYPVSPSTA